STVDACLNACEMWKAIERLKQGKSINVQDLKTNMYWEFGKFTSQDGESLELYYSRFYKMMNELIRNQCKVTNHQVNVQFLLQLQPKWQRFMTLVKQSQELKTVSYHKLYDILKQHQLEVNEIQAKKIARVANPLTLKSSTRSQQAATRNKGKAIVNSSQLIYDQEHSVDDDDDEMTKDKEIDKLMALISLSNVGYEHQRLGNVAGARETVDAVESGPIFDTEPEQKVQNDDHYDVFAIECQRPEQSESVHKTYLTKQDAHNVIIESVDMNYDSEPIDQNNEDADLAKNKSKAELKRRDSIEYASEMELECAKVRGDFLSYKMESQKSCNKYTQMINDLNQMISKMKNMLSAHQDTISIHSKEKEPQIKLYKTREDKELEKVIELENKVKNTIEQIFCPVISKINAGLDLFLKRLNEEMVVDLRYFNSLELEVDSLTSQLETQKTQFVNEIDRLSREYYYADHMNAILGVYTELDEVTNLQCDYLKLLQKCECLETELSKSKMMSKCFESV
nr:hypothetical protein [Tanacetum cinerariifolium]